MWGADCKHPNACPRPPPPPYPFHCALSQPALGAPSSGLLPWIWTALCFALASDSDGGASVPIP